MAEKRDNSGSLSRNKRKEKPTHADMKGSARIGGVDYWISGWTKDGTDGKWLSLAFDPKDADGRAATRTAGQAAKPAPADEPFDDDIPF